MIGADLPVPAAAVVTTDAYREVAAHPDIAMLTQRLRTATNGAPSAPSNLADRSVDDAFAAVGVSDGLRARILRARRLVAPAGPVAVRWSFKSRVGTGRHRWGAMPPNRRASRRCRCRKRCRTISATSGRLSRRRGSMMRRSVIEQPPPCSAVRFRSWRQRRWSHELDSSTNPWPSSIWSRARACRSNGSTWNRRSQLRKITRPGVMSPDSVSWPLPLVMWRKGWSSEFTPFIVDTARQTSSASASREETNSKSIGPLTTSL